MHSKSGLNTVVTKPGGEFSGRQNNWYMMLCAINSNGETKLLAEKGDWRGRDQTAEELLKMTYPKFSMGKRELLAAIPPTRATVEDFKMFAWDIVAWEFSCFIPKEYPEFKFFEKFKDIISNFSNNEELARSFLKYALSSIQKLYSELSVDAYLDEKPGENADYLWGYRRQRLVWMFEHLLRDSELRPFIFDGTPYDYRCFDLRYYFDKDEWNGESVLAVDIHT